MVGRGINSSWELLGFIGLPSPFIVEFFVLFLVSNKRFQSPKKKKKKKEEWRAGVGAEKTKASSSVLQGVCHFRWSHPHFQFQGKAYYNPLIRLKIYPPGPNCYSRFHT